MSEADDYLRAFLDQAAAEEAYLRQLREANDDKPGVTLPRPASAPAVSLMITNRQRAELRALGFSDEAVRLMTPAEAHAQLGLSKAGL